MMNLVLRCLAVPGLLCLLGAAVTAQPLKHNPVVGLFTVTPLEEAMTADQGLIESGAGFLFADGTAVGYDQIVIAPQSQVPEDELQNFLTQDGVLPLASDLIVEFSSWELREDETVTISGILASATDQGADQLATWGLEDPYVGRLLGGFVFSVDPVGRDLIGRDSVVDHIEYIALEPSAELISDAADFLVANGVLSKGEARVIEVSMRGIPSAASVPEPAGPLFGLVGALGCIGALRRRRG